MWIPRRRGGSVRRANRRWLPLLLLAGTPACGTASERPTAASLGRRQAELSGASVDRAYTGALALVTVTPETIELCTAVLITPNLLLTARHCIADTSTDTLQCSSNPAFFQEPYDTGSLWVNRAAALSGPLGSFGLLAVTGGSEEFVPVAEVRVPETDVVCGGDIAALILGAELAADEHSPLTPRLDEPVTSGEAYVAVGFGATLDGGEQGLRRSRQGLSVSCAGGDCQSSIALDAKEFAGGDGVCSGDSGGPAIASDGRVIGVASRSNDCTRSVYSALPGWRDFIRAATREAVLLGDYPAPTWLVEPPAPIPAPSGSAPSDAGGGGALPSDEAPAPVGADLPAPSEPAVTPAGDGGGCSLSALPVPQPRAAAPWLWLAACLAACAARKR